MILLVDQMDFVTAVTFIKLEQWFKELDPAAKAVGAHSLSRYGANYVGPQLKFAARISQMEADGKRVSTLYLRRFADEFAERQKKQTTETNLDGN